MKKVKIGIIGCGTIANNAHIPAYLKNPNVEIVYFCDIIEEKAKAAVEKYHCGKAVKYYHEVINDPEIDAVSICTPNSMHSVITIDALNAKKHVLCEKPAAKTYKEALAMQEAAHKNNCILNIGVVNRFNNAVNIIKDIIASGELGDIYSVYVSFRAHRSIPGIGGAFTTKAISGGGVLIDWGVHYLDIVMYCLNDPQPNTVSAEAFCKLGKDIKNYTFTSMWSLETMDLNGTYDVDDYVTGLVRTSGPTITFNGAWAQNIGVSETYIDFLGDKGGIRLQYGASFKIYSAKNGALMETTPSFNSTNHFENEINAFVDNVIHPEKRLPSHIDTVIITAKMMQAIYDSSDKHQEITL